MSKKSGKLVLSLLFLLIVTVTVVAGSEPAEVQSVSADVPVAVSESKEQEQVDYADMTAEQQEAYKERVKTEVTAAAIILAVFIFFVATVSAFRFTRNYRHTLKIQREKKFKYVDIWGNPRVHTDDLPTDEEMLGEDKLL